MNIFYLDRDVKACAEMHVDKHCVKMILEYAQLLSTAHRVLDGEEGVKLSISGRRMKAWILPDDREEHLYAATHVNHPSAIWTRESSGNYRWLRDLFWALCEEYTFRYGKIHKSSNLIDYLFHIPDNIPLDQFAPPALAMPDKYKQSNHIQAYRDYYLHEKSDLFSWKKRSIPNWVPQNSS